MAKQANTHNRTFIEEARRKQIVNATIETIAEQGGHKASLTEIAKTLGISQSVISYHFNGRSELMTETLNTIFYEINHYIKERVDAQSSATAKLRAYIDASFEFEQTHRNLFVTLVDLWSRFGSSKEERRFFGSTYTSCRRHLEKILLEGQETGEFGDFPALSVAGVIQAIIDGIMLQWVFDPEAVDLAVSRQEAVKMVEGYIKG
jgi:AcrR family transcriptional regulator